MKLISLKQLKGMRIIAQDGEAGRIDQFFFDDEHFTVRYLVVNTGNWLVRSEVLISPIAVQKINYDQKQIHVNLTREQVEKSPDIDTHMPISRQKELEYFQYFGWAHYWGEPSVWPRIGPYGVPYHGSMPLRIPPSDYEASGEKNRGEDSHLRSTKEVTGYRIKAIDGEFGSIEDFIIDDSSWSIRYFVVDTINYWPSKWVLVSYECVTNIKWDESRVYVNLPKEAIKSGPEYRPGEEIHRELHDSLLHHQGRPHYWKPNDPRSTIV